MARARMALLPLLLLLLLASAAFCATPFLAPRGAASSLRGSAAGSGQQPLALEAAVQARGGLEVIGTGFICSLAFVMAIVSVIVFVEDRMGLLVHPVP